MVYQSALQVKYHVPSHLAYILLNVHFHDELCINFVSNPSVVMCLQVESPAHYRRTPSWSFELWV